MSQGFSQNEKVNFAKLLPMFEDWMVLSKTAVINNDYKNSTAEAQRQGYAFWRPQPYILPTKTGTDQTANFITPAQSSVPVYINNSYSVPIVLPQLQYQDDWQMTQLADKAVYALSSQINQTINNEAFRLASKVIKRTTAPVGFDDISLADSVLNEIGVPQRDRYMLLPSRTYNSMAGNLGNRQTVNGIVQTAYEKALVGNISNFDVLKLDYSPTLAAATGVGVTLNMVSPAYVPQTTTTVGSAYTGQKNVDNRFQDITIAVTSGTVKVGDCFTIGVNSVHMQTKLTTNQLQTFRIVEIKSGAGGSGVVTITPPFISAPGPTPTALEVQMKNIDATPANGATLVFLNTVTTTPSLFYYREAIEIIPGYYNIPEGEGIGVMKMTSEQGFDLVMTKQADINTLNHKMRIDLFFGVANIMPEMSGIQLFSQT